MSARRAPLVDRVCRLAIAYGPETLSDERSDLARYGPDSHLHETTDRYEAEERARAVWSAAARRSTDGEAYLAQRGLDAADLVARDAVRFVGGDPCVSLRHLVDGRVINVVTRRREPGDGPKVLGMRGCTTHGSLVGRVSELCRDGVDTAMICEGVIDSLAGVLAFSGCAVLGAHGAGAMAELVGAAAIRIAATSGRLFIVPHVDRGAGERAAADSIIAAEGAGLTLDKSIHLVDVRPDKDLADAWAGGWRWRS